jgi:hypothetical protein
MSHHESDDSSMSSRELRFLELYFSGTTLKDAAKAAGYRGSSDQALCNTGRIILTRYEQNTSAQEIFRRVGASETRIASLLLNLAETAESEATRVHALGILSKCMGLQREPTEPARGARIIIEGRPPYEAKDNPQRVGGDATQIASLRITK